MHVSTSYEEKYATFSRKSPYLGRGGEYGEGWEPEYAECLRPMNPSLTARKIELLIKSRSLSEKINSCEMGPYWKYAFGVDVAPHTHLGSSEGFYQWTYRVTYSRGWSHFIYKPILGPRYWYSIVAQNRPS